MASCVKKTFDYIGNVAAAPFVIAFQGKERHYEPPSAIVVSDNLFRHYSCLDFNCSRCCWKTRHWNVYSPAQYQEMRANTTDEQYDITVPLAVNGKEFGFHFEDNTKDICKHLDRARNKCNIHEYNPIHCALPLMKFKRTKRAGGETTYITREVYTRNWFMQCPVKFSPFQEQGLRRTVQLLGRVETMAQELGIPTQLDRIIEEVERRGVEILRC